MAQCHVRVKGREAVVGELGATPASDTAQRVTSDGSPDSWCLISFSDGMRIMQCLLPPPVTARGFGESPVLGSW